MKKSFTFFTAYMYLAGTLFSVNSAYAQTTVSQSGDTIQLEHKIQYTQIHSIFRSLFVNIQNFFYSGDNRPMSNCIVAHSPADKRNKDKQFYCNEYPFGQTFNSTQSNDWLGVKNILTKEVSLTDKGNNNRNFYVQLNAPRSLKPFSIQQRPDFQIMGNLKSGDLAVDNFMGKQTYRTFVFDKSFILEVCTFHPGLQVGGVSHSQTINGKRVNSFDYTIFKLGPFTETVTVAMNMGQYSFDSMEWCFLIRTPKNSTEKNIAVLDISPPKLSNVKLSGTEINVSGISFWTSMAAAIIGFFAGIVSFFKTGNIKYLGLSIGSFLAGALQFITGPFFNVLQSLTNKIINDVIMPKITARAEDYIKNGEYIKHLVESDMSGIVAYQVIDTAKSLKTNDELKSQNSPVEIFGYACQDLVSRSSENYQVKAEGTAVCKQLSAQIYNSNSNSADCNKQILVQSVGIENETNKCSLTLKIEAKAPPKLLDVWQCITHAKFEKSRDLISCYETIDSFLAEVGIKLTAKKLNISGPIDEIAGKINLYRDNPKKFLEIDVFVKSIMKSQYNPSVSLTILDRVINKGESLELIKSDLLASSGANVKILDLYKKFYKRVPTNSEYNQRLIELRSKSIEAVELSIANSAKLIFNFSLNRVSVDVTNQGSSSSELNEWFNIWLNYSGSLEQIKAEYLTALISSARLKIAYQKAMLNKSNRKVALDESKFAAIVGMLKSGKKYNNVYSIL